MSPRPKLFFRSLAVTTGLLVVLFGLVLPAHAGEHVRVVLDVSGSMTKNDPGRLALLTTLLLYDLAAPNPTLGDSFEILPFDRDWRWEAPDDPPPEARRDPLVARHEGRRELIEAFAGLAYDARMTYFYPGLRAAVEDLRQTPGGERDVRTIVLVTDGVPELPTRHEEIEQIRRDIVPELFEHGIRLYILAFSDEAERHRDVLDAMVRGPAEERLGAVFLDPRGDHLLTHMLEIFARSFGYTPDAARELPDAGPLDLEAGSRAERVAVVVHAPRREPPALRLVPPSRGALNAPGGVVSAAEEGGSYSLLWALSPDAGTYGFRTDARQGSVALLRPARLELEVLLASGRNQADVVMAERPFPLRIRVRSPIGAKGDPGPVELSFRPLGERLDDGEGSEGEQLAYAWRGDLGAPPAGPGTPGEEGRDYEIVVEMAENPRREGEVYVGRLELEARRGEAVVGARLADDAHRLEVHPHLALAPLPLKAYASESALDAWETGCTRFKLTVDAGNLPHPERDDYPLRAVIDPEDPAILERELRDALFTLDGVPLRAERQGGPQPGAWYKGRTLDREELLAEHELCVRLGKPTRGDPASPFEVPLTVTLLEAPYDDFDVIEPFTLKVLVAPPGVLERFSVVMFFGAGLAVLLVLLWYLRDRPGLPRDLSYTLVRDGLSGGLPGGLARLRPLGAGPLLGRLLGRTVERPLVAAEGNATLAWLRPTDEELYRVRPAENVRILDENGSAVPVTRGLATLEARRPYQLDGPHGRHLLRLGYI